VGKTFTKKGDTIYVKCMGLCLKLNSAKSFLRIDNTINISTSGVKHPTLNVYRNSPYIIGRLFKNKIKLYDITEDNYEKMKIEAQRIADLLGIPFKDSYDFDDPW
jgi:hypothetical protein